MRVIAEAGAPLQTVQQAADAAGLFFGVDIGARGTATIGGNVATNAGGIRVLRYGMFRAQVTGLEAVLADGSVLSSLRGLAKDNTGYDLGQLLVGSEGTLGVVTKACLRLHPRPAGETAAFCALPSLDAALALLARLRERAGSVLSAFEGIFPAMYEAAAGMLGPAAPLKAGAGFYVLAEIQGDDPERDTALFQDVLMAACEEGLVDDVVVSQSGREFEALWRAREGCNDFLTAPENRGRVLGLDVSLPLGRMAGFMADSEAALARLDPAAGIYVFGHLGDGNLHYQVMTPLKAEAAGIVMERAAAHGGSISAEHGIGVDKKPWLHLSRSDAEIAAMRRVKRALDPNAILNRGRIFS